MTCIVTFPGQGLPRKDSKKQLRELLTGRDAERMAYRVIITDPSIFKPRDFLASDMTIGQKEVVTNHPKRSWFAQIERTATGWKVT